MDHPVKDISAVLRKVTRGTPEEQSDALKAYFLPHAALETALLRVPPMPDMSVSYLGIINSRRLIYVLCRLSKLLVRTHEFDIRAAVYDQRSATLTLQTNRTISPFHLPFHKPSIESTVILRLAQRSIDAHGRVIPPDEDPSPLAMGVRTRLYVAGVEDLIQPSEMLKVFVPFLGAGIGWVVRMWATAWLVLMGSVLVLLSGLLPEAVVKNGNVVTMDKKK